MKSLVLKLFLFSFLLIGGGEVFAAKYYVGGDEENFGRRNYYQVLPFGPSVLQAPQ